MARTEITLGFVGSGKVEKRNAFHLLRDFIDANGGNAKFILPLTKDFWNPAMQVVSDFAIENAIPVEAIVDDSTAKVRELKALLVGARRQHSSAAVAHKMATLLGEARKSHLIVLWNDEDEGAMDAVKAADEQGVGLLELTRGLDVIELVAGDDEDEEPETDEVEDEAGIVGQDENDEDVEGPTEDSEDEEIDSEVEEEAEFEDVEAEEDLDIEAQTSPQEQDDADDDDDADAEDDDEEDDEADLEEEGEFVLPEEDESDVAVLDMEQDIVEEVRSVTGMSEFQRRLLAVLENTSEAFVRAIDALMTDADLPAPKPKAAAPKPVAKPAPKPAAARPAKKVAAPVKKPAPAKKAAPVAEKAPVKRTVPAKKAAAEPSTNGHKQMSKAAAQRIIDEYRPRRGRPPADVTEARKILGLA